MIVNPLQQYNFQHLISHGSLHPKWHITPRMIFGGPEPQNAAGKFPKFPDSTSQKGHFEKHDFLAKVVS